MEIVGILNARGNNTLTDKNLQLVNGKPLMYWPITAMKKSKLINNFFVSSDDTNILNIGSSLGLNVIKRPSDMGLPTAEQVDAIQHSITELAYRNINPDILVVVLGNSVSIKSEWIDECIEILQNDSTLTAVVPAVKNNDLHPYRAKQINDNGLFVPFFNFSEMDVSSNRQELPDSYFLCHNFWVFRTENLSNLDQGQKPWTYLGNAIKPYIIDYSIDVHTPDDLIKSSNWLNNNLK